MDKTLAFWVDAKIAEVQIIEDPNAKPKKLARAILQEFERVGNACRRLDKKGRVVWRATPAMHDYLKDAQAEAEDDLDDPW
jgi:hypothetical protein